MNRQRIRQILLSLTIISISVFHGCSSDDGSSSPSSNGGSSSGSGSNSSSTLVIENGAQTIENGATLNYSANLVNANGTVSQPVSVSWSSSNPNIANISGSGTLNSTSNGAITITAETSATGEKLTASVSLSILQKNPPFQVVPGAIIWQAGADDIQLTSVYFGNENPTYTYRSSDASIANVNSNGSISFLKAGRCVISVTSSAANNPVIQVPVEVVGSIPSIFPISKVTLFNNQQEKVVLHKMFRNQSAQFSAKAYDVTGAEVATQFNWSFTDNSIASVDQDGLLNTKGKIGRSILQATASGISGQVEVFVYPDSAIVVSPIFKLNVTSGSSHQLSADLYTINRTTFGLNSSPIQSPAQNIDWEVLPTKIDLFNPGVPVPPATVTSNGLVTVNQDVLPGDIVITQASIPGTQAEIGVSTLVVGL